MSDEKKMFTYSEALQLLQNSWGVKNVEDRLKNDRKSLVDEIIQIIHEKVPFQNITILSSSDRNTRPLLHNDIRERCVSGVGGLCYDLATFVWSLFWALGFTVQMLSATSTVNCIVPNNHTIVCIYGLENESDVHLIDCASGFATLRSISLNFPDDSPIFKDSFLEYKYIRHNGKILRMHGKGDSFKRNSPPIEGLDFIQGHWRRFYFLDPDQKLYHPYKPAEDAYRAVMVSLTSFALSPRAVWFPKKRAVVIVNNKLMIENEAGELVTTVLTSDEEILKAYQVHFPQLKQDDVRLALAEWDRLQSKS